MTGWDVEPQDTNSRSTSTLFSGERKIRGYRPQDQFPVTFFPLIYKITLALNTTLYVQSQPSVKI